MTTFDHRSRSVTAAEHQKVRLHFAASCTTGCTTGRTTSCKV